MYDPPRILPLLEHNMVKHNITELPPVVCVYVGFILNDFPRFIIQKLIEDESIFIHSSALKELCDRENWDGVRMVLSTQTWISKRPLLLISVARAW